MKGEQNVPGAHHVDFDVRVWRRHVLVMERRSIALAFCSETSDGISWLLLYATAVNTHAPGPKGATVVPSSKNNCKTAENK